MFRTRTIVLGLLLIAIPTAFALFPEMAEWRILWRGVIGGIWLVIAFITVREATRRDSQLAGLVAAKVKLRERARRRATLEILRALLTSGVKGTPTHFRWTVYLYDGSAWLRPFFPTNVTDLTDVRVFRVGDGATGKAFKTGGTFVVTGDAVSNDKHGLTQQQQEHFFDYRSVVATPIWDIDGDRAIGTLTAIAKPEDDVFESAAGGAIIRELADTVGVVLSSIELRG